MNKKIIVKRHDGQHCYCILSGDEGLEAQLNQWYFGEAQPKHGMCVNFNGITVDVVDYYHAEPMASFAVVCIEDTDEDVLPKWVDL